MYRIVRFSSDPVVQTYMQIIYNACLLINKDCEYIVYKQKTDRKAFIISETVLCALYYYLRGYRNHIVWIQGVMPEESLMRNNSKIRYYVLSVIEKFILKRAKFLFFVSESMKEHYIKKYNIEVDQKCFIMPCFNELCINESAFSIENKYNSNTFVYVGSLNKWQCFDSIIKLYTAIEERCGNNTKLYVFTKEKEKALEVINQNRTQNYQIDYVSAEKLGETICQYKYGFVLRDDCIVNTVATPTKLSNYISQGIIPIYSSCLQSFHKINQDIELAVVADIENIQKSANEIVEHMHKNIQKEDVKKKCKAFFDDYYNSEKYVLSIKERMMDAIVNKG